MNELLNKPKRFGEMLDTVFQVSKNRFSEYFLIMLIIVGPLYLLQALLLAVWGTNFFSEVDSGGGWTERVVTAFDQAADTDTGGDVTEVVTGIPGLVLTPVAFSAVLIAIYRLKKNQEFTVASSIKQAFSRFWQILGSSIVFTLIAAAMGFSSIFIITLFGIAGAIGSLTSAIIMIIILVVGLGFVMLYLFTRWGFFLGITVFEGDVPALGKSWHFTRKYIWKTMGIFLVFFLIFACIQLGMESIFLPLLGESVLYDIILSVIRLVTNTIFAVGYAIVFFDIKDRHDGDDLKEMIQDYEQEQN